MKLITTFVLVAVLSAVSVQAQPTPQTIVDRALAAYEAAFAGVDSYMITTEVMGVTSTTYAERVPDGGPLDFTTYMVMPDGQLMEDDDLMMDFTAEEMLRTIAQRGQYAGEHQINGATAYAIEVEDVEDLLDESDLPDADDYEFESATFYFAADSHFLVGFDASGTVREAGPDALMTMSLRFSDYRTVSGLTWPHLMTMNIDGMAGIMSEEEMQEMAEFREQLANMPPEQREMFEAMMGDQIEMLDTMLSGEGMEVNVRVTDVQVNIPRP